MKLEEAAGIIARLEAVPLPHAHRKPTTKAWERLEKACGRPIPEVFKTFLTIYNGYSFQVALFDLGKPAFAKQGGVEVFYGFGSQFNLISEWKVLEGRMPGGFLPFGHGGTGNPVCLDTNTKRGAVYYWDHELEHLGPWGCVAKAASTFDSFLRSLKPLESDE